MESCKVAWKITKENGGRTDNKTHLEKERINKRCWELKRFQRGTVAPFCLKSTTRQFGWSAEGQCTRCCIQTQLGWILL